MNGFNDNQKSMMGRRLTWGGEEPFYLSTADRAQHLYILGQTGSGKSSLITNLLVQDIQEGRGCTIVDPHGEMANSVLDYVPPSRIDDVFFFSPADLEYPIGFNLLSGATPDQIHLVASSIVSSFKSLWASSWGPRMENLLFASLSALVECCYRTGNVSLLGLQRMLVDDKYRAWVVSHVQDVAVHNFWAVEFEQYDPRFRTEVTSPVLNKVNQLIMAPVLRNILGQVRKSLDVRYAMDTNRIVVADLSKGRIGEDKANLLGSLLISQFEQAALSRANVAPHERREHFLFVDEFQSYLTDSFSGLISECRKYRLAITLVNQHLAQIEPGIRDAILGNCGNLLAFRTSEKDASILSREFGGAFPPDQFTDLANYNVLVKVLDAGQHRDPFRGITLPPLGRFYGKRQKIIDRSRERFATPRSIVEDKIRRWMKG